MADMNQNNLRGVFLIGLIALLSIKDVSAYGSGAPFSTCLTRYPKHSHTDTQTGAGPFTITISPETYNPGDDISVSISSQDNRAFVGFQIAGFREDNPLEVVGKFEEFPENKAKLFTCYGSYVGNMATHKNKDEVHNISLTWKSPLDNVGDIDFKATVVENYYTFWTHVEKKLQSSGRSSIVQAKVPYVETDSLVDQTDLSGCGDSKSCFLYPRHCDDNDCIAGVSFEYRKDTDDYLVEMYADPGSEQGYVGVAFSDDEKMGKDETFTCTANTEEMSVQYGHNPAYYNERVITRYVSDAKVKRVDGKLQCSFVIKPNSTVITVNHGASAEGNLAFIEQNFDKDQSWYIQLAWGPVMTDSNVITRHVDQPPTTSSRVRISEKDVYRGSAYHTLIHVHAALMIVAWTFLSGIATVVARHYRDMLPKHLLFGTKVWFQLHRALAILITILTGIGLTIIFSHYGTPIRKHAKPHAYWGIAVTCALGVQVIAGMLRPGADHKLRVVFNWGHRFLGHASHVLAAVTMFLGFDFDYTTEDQHDFGTIALGIWVGVQIMWHIFFEIVSWLLKRTVSYDVKEDEGKTSIIPAILMVIYLLFLAACCTAVLCAFLFY